MIKVLLFAGLKERAGTDHILIEASSLTVKELKAHLTKEIEGLNHLEEALIAVNEIYAADEQQVTERDIVAIIPPVSGG